MATEAALKLPELLESVLACSNWHDLLLARGVSTTWRTLIESSPTLRKQLFLDPGTADRIHLDMATTTAPDPFGILGKQSVLSFMEFQTHPRFTSLIPHPASEDGREEPWTISLRLPYKGPPFYMTVETYAFRWTTKNMDDICKSPIARQMLLTQPPCTVLDLVVPSISDPEGHYLRATVFDASGVRFGLIMDTFVDMIKSVEEQEECGRVTGTAPFVVSFGMQDAAAEVEGTSKDA